MKRIVEVFTEDEFENLKELKSRTKLNWHDFIMEGAKLIKQNRKEGMK